MHHTVDPRRTLIGLLAAGVWLVVPAAPALAVDSATCTPGGDPHAGRQFTLSARTEPIVGDYTYRWDLDDDGAFETDTGTDANVRTERTAAGTFTFGVAVTDAEAAAGDPKREVRGKCEVTVVNDKPIPNFEVHPVAESFPTAFEATRFTYSGSDNENDLNQRALTHAIDFDGDGRFEYTDEGAGEVFASFPAGFDKDVTHRVTDAAGASVETRLRIKTTRDAFGFGGNAVIAPVGTGPLGKVTATAPKSVKRKTLLERGVVATFSWGATWGRAAVVPAVGRSKGSFAYQGDAGYAPGQRLTIQKLPPSLAKLIRRGAKKIQLRWTARGLSGAEQTGTLVVRIKR